VVKQKENMKSIMATYPEFQALPRGVKRLLLTSENFFFNDAASPAAKPGTASSTHVHPWVPSSSFVYGELNSNVSPAWNHEHPQLV
jgi:hypothetical protein